MPCSIHETECVITAPNGTKHEAGGAFIDGDRLLAYAGPNETLTDWHGNPIGSLRWRSKHRVYGSAWGTDYHYGRAIVGGIVYSVHGWGTGMLVRGKRTNQPFR